MAKNEKKTPEEEKARQRLNGSEAAEPQGEAPQTPADEPPIDPIQAPDVDTERELLEQKYAAAREAAEKQIDRTVEEGTEALRRAEEDAQPGFQSMRDRIDLEERQALDNQALYAELRGDRGGIGAAQYASIQNAAAVNRRQVGLEQQRLATETARQIEDLRRKGEFQKADELLKLTQQQLSELMELERWAKEQGLSVEKFNIELARWKAEYAWKLQRFGIEMELKLAKQTGAKGYGQRQAERGKLGSFAKKLKELGLTLSQELLDAVGWSEGKFEDFIRGYQETLDGEGVPFQLFESWMSALKQSEDREETYRLMRQSDWFEKMSLEQRQRLWAALK